MNLFYKFQRFMMGRYGVDSLFYGLIMASAVLSIINIFVHSFILQLIVYAFIVYAFVRVMSKNHAARSRENMFFMSVAQKIKKKRDTARQRKADINHIYKKCPECKAVLRLPRKKGKHTTVCPKCNHSFNVTVK